MFLSFITPLTCTLFDSISLTLVLSLTCYLPHSESSLSQLLICLLSLIHNRSHSCSLSLSLFLSLILSFSLARRCLLSLSLVVSFSRCLSLPHYRCLSFSPLSHSVLSVSHAWSHSLIAPLTVMSSLSTLHQCTHCLTSSLNIHAFFHCLLSLSETRSLSRSPLQAISLSLCHSFLFSLVVSLSLPHTCLCVFHSLSDSLIHDRSHSFALSLIVSLTRCLSQYIIIVSVVVCFCLSRSLSHTRYRSHSFTSRLR